MEAKILYTSEEVRKEIIELFPNKSTRRIAISAFVGEGADSFLRYHDDIELYCWPLPGATNPDALETLQKMGVKIFFSDNSHIKLYLAKNKGAIITSANLSRNALGASIQKEFGILIDDSLININRVLKYIGHYKPTKGDFDKLRREHNKISKTGLSGKKSKTTKTFGDWYNAPKDSRESWKFTRFEPDDGVHFCIDAKKIAKEKYSCEPHDYLGCRKNDYKRGEWILCFISKQKKQFSNFHWMYVDEVAKVEKTEKKIYRKDVVAQAVQIQQRINSNPPFKLSSIFKKSFKEMFKEKGDDFYEDIIDSKKLSQRTLNAIFSIYKTLPESK